MYGEVEFETHITLSAADLEQVEALKRLAAKRGHKFVHILLDRGLSASQPMLTRQGRGTFESQLRIVREECEHLKTEGFSVSRIKLEAAVSNPMVPLMDSDASEEQPDRYFEHHVKLLLNADTDHVALADSVKPFSAHLSRNALRHREDGWQERFVTQRCHHVGRDTAMQQLQGLLHALKKKRIALLEVESEYVVYDSNLALDAGWIEMKE